jgi:hypothetical protein
VAAWFPRFCYFYLVKNQKITKNSTATEAREKISADLESLDFSKNFDACVTIFKNNRILLYKIGHRFLLTTKLFTGQKRLFGKNSTI